VTRSYWLDLFTAETWAEFLAHGGDVDGFSGRRWPSVKRIRPGDYLMCYLIRVSKFVGLLEAVGEPFLDEQVIWHSGEYPSRVPVRMILALDPKQGIPVLEMRDKLSIFHNLANPRYWSGHFQTSPGRWNAGDGEVVCRELKEARERQGYNKSTLQLASWRSRGTVGCCVPQSNRVVR
jgi:hypothetical protein